MKRTKRLAIPKKFTWSISLALSVAGLGVWLHLLSPSMAVGALDSQGSVIPSPQTLIPPIPLTLWGTVLDGGANVSIGTEVKGFCEGVDLAYVAVSQAEIWSGKTETWYALEIPGDRSETAGVKEGCALFGDVIHFTIGDDSAVESMIWVEGGGQEFHLTVARPQLEVEKYANGQEADSEGAALQLQPGVPVTWTYAVTNTGNVTVTNIVISDSNGTEIDSSDDFQVCSFVFLKAGQSAACPEQGSTAVEGLFANRATVEGAFETLVVGPTAIIPEIIVSKHQDWAFYKGVDRRSVYLPLLVKQ